MEGDLNLNDEQLGEMCGNAVSQVMMEQIRRRRVAAVLAILQKNKNKNEVKRLYKKKQHWVAPLFQNRSDHGFYHASLPKLQLEDIRFHNYFRMSATQLEDLLFIIGPRLQKQDFIREAITPSERLAVTLRYLASGDSMTSMTFQYLMGKTTICNIIHETCIAIWDCLCPSVLPSVLSEEEWIKLAQDFQEVTNFIHCIGAIDGKHIVIQCPNNAGSTYYNYKGAHSIVLLAICNAKYIFSYVDIGAYGRRSDGGIFQASMIGKKFDADRMNVPKPAAIEGGRVLPYCLVGDEAFPLKSYLLRPYPGKNGLTPQQDVYNYRLSRARRMIENTFGILASQWRIYRKPIIANPENVKSMIQATVCLHNWLRKSDVDKTAYVSAGLVDEDAPDSPNGFRPGSWRRIMEAGCAFRDITRCGSNMSARRCMTIRDEFRDYFNNEGAVAWQEGR